LPPKDAAVVATLALVGVVTVGAAKATGVTAAEAPEAAPVPAALVAVTVKV
jgi:hypothetical protein